VVAGAVAVGGGTTWRASRGRSPWRLRIAAPAITRITTVMAAAACEASAGSFPRACDVAERLGERVSNLPVAGVRCVVATGGGTNVNTGVALSSDALEAVPSAAFAAFAREMRATDFGLPVTGAGRSLAVPTPCGSPATCRIERICPCSARPLLCFIGTSPPVAPADRGPRPSSPPITYRLPGGRATTGFRQVSCRSPVCHTGPILIRQIIGAAAFTRQSAYTDGGRIYLNP
jgi:hypothetical protein